MFLLVGTGDSNDDSLVLDGGRHGEWTPHDLRRTAATMMQSIGISPDVIDRCQNHVLPGSRVRRHYLHHDYAAEKRAAWQALGRRLEAVAQNAAAVTCSLTFSRQRRTKLFSLRELLELLLATLAVIQLDALSHSNAANLLKNSVRELWRATLRKPTSQIEPGTTFATWPSVE